MIAARVADPVEEAMKIATGCAKRWFLPNGDQLAMVKKDGDQLAMVKKALISPVRDRFTVKIGGGPDLEVKGNIVNHEYTIGEGHDKVAQVSKKWFRVRDSHGVEIEPGQNDIIILAVAVCIDQMAR
jgi:uncharacterized protein YxjI